MTPSVIVMLLSLLGIISLPVGIVVLDQSNALYEKSVKYGGSGKSDIDCSSTCSASYSIDRDMDGPLYLYYELTNFYQNNIKYQKSISWTQLSGDPDWSDEVENSCSPLLQNNSLNLNPCGLVANSFFTDEYALNTVAATINGVANAASISLDETQLVFTSEEYFVQPDGFANVVVGSCPASCANGQVTETCSTSECSTNSISSPCKCYSDGTSTYLYHYPDDDTTAYLYEMYPNQITPLEGVTNEHFKVWMTIAGLPAFRKPYGKLDGPFKKGDTVVFNVGSYYDVKEYGGTKSLILTEKYSLGNPNAGIGITYIVCGTISLAVAIIFFLKQEFAPRPLGSPAELNWN